MASGLVSAEKRFALSGLLFKPIAILMTWVVGSGFVQADETWDLIGLELTAEPAYVVAIKDIPFKVGFRFNQNDFSDNPQAIPQGWQLAMEYQPPGGAAPTLKTIPLTWSGSVVFQAGGGEGVGSVSGWRILNQSGQVIRVFSQNLTVEVLGEILIPEVEINRLSRQEMEELGVSINDDSYVGIQVDLELEIQPGETIDTEIVLIKNEISGEYEAIKTQNHSLKFYPVHLVWERPPRVKVKSSPDVFQATTQSIPRPRRTLPQLDALIVLPANIGYLNSFFKPTLILLNVAPEDTSYTVRNLSAEMSFNSDSLSLPDLGGSPQYSDIYVTGPGPDGVAGNADDTNEIGPQQRGFASWVIEALKPGEQTLDFHFRGTILADDGASYPITGDARGYLYIRRPEMSLHFDIPSVVREGEEFDIDAIFTNRNGVPVYDLRFEIDSNAIQGAQLNDITPLVNGTPVSVVDLENEGDEAIFRMNLISLSTGKVAVTQLSGGEDLGGPLTYSIHVAVGEHGLPLSAMTLIMPRALSRLSEAPFFFPNSVEADLKTVAGRALSLAQIPPGTEENGLRYIPEDAIKDWIQALTFAYLKPRSGTIEEQKRDLVLDFFFATLAQPKSLLDFLQQDSKYAEWAQNLANEVNGIEDLMTADVMAPCLAFLVENDPLSGARGALSFGPFGSGSDVTGTFFRDDFEHITWQPTTTSTAGWFFDGRRWGRFTFTTQGGEVTVIWNGFNLEFIEDGTRVYPQWVWGEPQSPTLLAARQVGLELLTIDPDLYGRQVLLYFSAPVLLDEAFASRFKIDNNQVLRADRLTDHVIQVWARNPMGLIERDIHMDDGVQSVGGTPLEPATRAIQMSEYLHGTTLDGIVLGPSGEPVPAAEVRLIQTATRLNNAPAIEFDGYDELAASGNQDLAMQIKQSLELLAEQQAQTRQHGQSYIQEFGVLTGLDGSYHVDYWPFYRNHDDPRYPCCGQCPANPPYPCSTRTPDLLWSVRWNGRQVDRLIYGRYAGQAVRYDFVFTPRGHFQVQIPSLASGEEALPEDIVYVQALDQDEFRVSHALLPGESIQFTNMRLGPISILAQGVGGFDAQSFTLRPNNLGTVITLDPATVPATLTAQMRTLDENGDTVPLTDGAILIRHYGTVFGGIPPSTVPNIFAGVGLKGFDNGNITFEVPEGTMDILYIRDWFSFSQVDWRTVEAHAGETVDLGTFLYTPSETGTLTVHVEDSMGTPVAGIAVEVRDGLSRTIQESDETGIVVFEGVMVGFGTATVRKYGVIHTQGFTLASPNQLETQISFILDSPFTLDVQVIDENGSPLPNAWVQVSDYQRPELPRFPAQAALSGADGHITFEWVGFVPEFEYAMFIETQHPINFRTTGKIYTRPLDVFQGQTTVTFPESGSAHLTIYSEDTLERLENVWVELKDSAGSTYANVTDAQGEVVLTGLNPGTADVVMLPSQGLRANYVKTEATVVVTSGQTFEGDLLLRKKRVIVPKFISIAGQVFDAMNEHVESQIKYRLSVEAHGPEMPQGDIFLGDFFTTEAGAIDLHNIEIPDGAVSYTFSAQVFDNDTGRFGQGKWLWDQRLAVPFLPISLNGNIHVPVRIWDTLGRRVSVGSVHFTQAQVIDNSMQEVTLEELVTLSEENFEPSFQVRTTIPFCIIYEGPSAPYNGFCERTVVELADDGRPIDIVIRPLSELQIAVQDGTGEPLNDGIFLQIFKDNKLWQEQRYEPDSQSGVMTLPDLPLGRWSVLAMQISTGVADGWYGTVGENNERIQLTIQPGQDFIGSIVNDTGTPVPDAQLTLARQSGTLAYSGSRATGVSKQVLLGTSDIDGLFSFPSLTRGNYSLSVYDPFTNRHSTVSFSVPETEDLRVVMQPVGKLHLTGYLSTGDLAVGAKLTVFRGVNQLFGGHLDGANADFLTPFLPAGPITFLVETPDNTLVTMVHTEIVSDATTEAQAYLDIPEFRPLIGFQWDTNENIEERILVQWEWTALGGLAHRQGSVIYPDGTPIQFDFLEGRVHLRITIDASQSHSYVVREYDIQLDDPEADYLFTVELPRILEVTVVDQATMAPIEGAIVSGRSRAYTDGSGLARIKNITKGENIEVHIVTLDQQYYGAANVIIGEDQVTRVTVPVNSNVGDLDFHFTQRGFPHRFGLIELQGQGVNFVRVLDGNDQVGFRFVIQGSYSYRYVDPVSGVLVNGQISVVPGNRVSETIEVPGSSPLVFIGEFDGGTPLIEGQVIEVATTLKTFTAAVGENMQGQQQAYFPLLPEGQWRLSTSTIPKNQWNPSIDILFGTVNRYEALGAQALPFWVRANVFFADFWDVPIPKFTVRRYPASGNNYYETRYYTGGLGVMSLPPGTWRLQFNPENSPVFHWSDPITVSTPDQVFELREKIPQETASVRLSAHNTEGAFLNSYVRVSALGWTSPKYRTANPFLTWDYLPTWDTTSLTVAQYYNGSGARMVSDLMLQPGYQELQDIVLDVVPPSANLTMTLTGTGEADLVATTDKPAAQLRAGFPGRSWMNFTYNQSLDNWTFHVADFINPWKVGTNEIRVEVTGLSSARTTTSHFVEWPSATQIVISDSGPFDSLPQHLEFTVSDPGFVLDPDRTVYVYNGPESHHVRINYRDVPYTLLPSSDGASVEVVVLVYPWQLGVNNIDILFFDLDGNPAGLSDEILFQNLPEDGIVHFPDLRYGNDPEMDVTIHAIAPDGTPSSYDVLGQQSYTLSGLAYGDWKFHVVNHHAQGSGAIHHFGLLDSPTGIQFNNPPLQANSMTYTVLNRFGQPYPGVEVHVVTNGSEPKIWDHGTKTTNSNGQVTWVDLPLRLYSYSTQYYKVTVDYGNYQVTSTHAPTDQTVQDPGGGDILVRALDSFTNLEPIPGLEIYLDDEWVGTTDLQGEWASDDTYILGTQLDLRVQGTTSTGGDVFYDETITAIQDRLDVNLLLEPYYEGQLDLSLGSGFEGLQGTLEFERYSLSFPFTGTQSLPVQEGHYEIEVTSRWGDVWFSVPVDIARNQTAALTLNGPPASQTATAAVHVQDTSGTAIANAIVVADGVSLGTTDTNGDLNLSMFPTTYRFVTAAVQGSISQNVTLSAGEAQTVTLTTSEFSAQSIANNLVWFKADPGTLYVDEGAIAQWVDLSGQNNDGIQNQKENRPITRTSDYGTHQTVVFDGENDFFDMPAGFDNFNFGLTAIFVANIGQKTQSQSATWLELGQQNGSYQVELLKLGGSRNLYYKVEAPSAQTINEPEVIDYYRTSAYTVHQQGTAVKMLTDNVQEGVGTVHVPTGVPRDLNRIGASATGNSTFFGELVEVMIFNRALTPAELDTVHAYLSDTYGTYTPTAAWIASLPQEAQDETHRLQLSRDEAQRYAGFVAAHPELPTRGMAFWADADQGAITVEGETVGWQDQSYRQHPARPGEIWNNQFYVPSFPETSPNLINGKDAWHFDGSHFFQIHDIAPTLSLDATIFTVAYPTRIGYSSRLSLWSVADETRYVRQRLSVYATGHLELNYELIHEAPLLDRWSIVAFGQQANGNTYTRVNGEPGLDGLSLTPDPDTAQLNIGGDGSSNFTGEIAEVIVYDRTLSSDEIEQVEYYLAERYALDVAVPEPHFDPAGGIYPTAQTITLNALVSLGAIHYTLDGSEPDETDPFVVPGGTLSITADTLLRARLYIPNKSPGKIASATYLIRDLGANAYLAQPNDTIWAVGTTGQDVEGMDIYVSGTELTCIGPHDFASMTVINGAVVTHRTQEIPGIDLTISGDVLIDHSSRFDASERGYVKGTGPGRSTNGYAAGYGGRGSGGTFAGPTYGDPYDPRDLGSGGDTISSQGGGTGGGVVILDITGSLTLNGAIEANGQHGRSSDASGSGGSVNIHAERILGTGHISAHGGDGNYADWVTDSGTNGGGGGRVALTYDEALSTFDIDRVSTRNGIDGDSQSGSIVINGGFHTAPTTLIYKLITGEPNTAGRYIRLNHTDGRELTEITDQNGDVAFSGIRVGDVWEIQFSMDGTNWYLVGDLSVGQREYLRSYLNICMNDIVYIHARYDLRGKELEWFIDGQATYIYSVHTDSSSYDRYILLAPIAGLHTLVEAYLPGFSNPIFSQTLFLDCNASNTVGPATWPSTALRTYAADGTSYIPYRNDVATYLQELLYVDQVTGAEYPAAVPSYYTYIAASGGSLYYNLRCPTDGSVALRYRLAAPTSEAVIAQGLAQAVDGSFPVTLPFPVADLLVLDDLGNPLPDFKYYSESFSETVGVTPDYENHHHFILVNGYPYNYDFDYSIRYDDIWVEPGTLTTSALVDTGTANLGPHFKLIAPQQVTATTVDLNVGNSEALSWIANMVSDIGGEKEHDGQAHVDTYQLWDDTEIIDNEIPFYLSPGRLWAAYASRFPTRYGTAGSVGEQEILDWLPGNELQTADIEVRLDTNWIMQLTDTYFGYQLWTYDWDLTYISEATGASDYDPYYKSQTAKRRDIDSFYLFDVPVGNRAWIFVTYEADIGNAYKSGKDLGTSQAIARVYEVQITQDHVDNGIDLPFQAYEPYVWDSEHSIGLGPGFITDRVDYGGGYEENFPRFCFGSPYYFIPNRFFLNPLGWIGFVDTHSSSTDDKLAFRTHLIDFSGRLGGTELSIPLSFSGQFGTTYDPTQSMATTDFHLGMLTGLSGAAVEPTLTNPVEGNNFEGTFNMHMVFTLPFEMQNEWDLVFPAMVGPINTSATQFNQEFQDWKTAFPNLTDPFWLELPQEWRDAAQNWQLP